MKQKIFQLNIPVIELTKRVFNNGCISARGLMILPIYYLKLIIVMPGALLQRMFYYRQIKSTSIAKQPIFIIGHYRSGTTYLHKLLCADKRFGYINHYDMICPNTSLLFGNWLKDALQFIINKLQLKTSFFNNTIPILDEPAEEERYLINKGSAYANYWKFVFPLRENAWQTNLLNDEKYYENWKKEYMWLLKFLNYKNKGKQLILKSPCNTERIKYLLQLYPGAKFIYISRDPYRVYYSMVNLWQKAIQKFCLQKISSKQRDKIIFSHYTYITEEYKKHKHLIPAGNLVEVQYEELESKPLTVLKKIYKHLHFPEFQIAYGNFLIQLERESHYKRFEYSYIEETLKKIEQHWSKYINEWKSNALKSVHAV
jgi:hypothetical protein